MLKRISLILILLCTLTISTCFANELIIEDDAGLFTEDEIALLKIDMTPLTEFGGIALKTISSNNTSANNYIKNYFFTKFNKRQSATVFLIDMANKEIRIFSDGRNYNIITNAKADIITDNVYHYATRGDYYTCTKVALEQIQTLLEGGKISEPMRYISSALVAIVLSFLLSFLFIMKKSKINKISKQDIINKAKVNFEILNVSSIKTGERAVYSPPSSSSSGGSSGGGFSSYSSGGGGGHKF